MYSFCHCNFSDDAETIQRKHVIRVVTCARLFHVNEKSCIYELLVFIFLL